MCRLHRVAARKWGRAGSLLSQALLLSQFHVLFYSSRPLPNTFALLFVTAACASWAAAPSLPTAAATANSGGSDTTAAVAAHAYWKAWGWSWQIAQACGMLTAATVWFRCDMLVFLFPALICMLWQHKVGIVPLVAFGLVFGVGTLALTVGVDSVFWGRWLWPEGEVFFFNAIQGGSVAWGTSPWHWYVTSALPRALLGALPLCVLFLLQGLFGAAGLGKAHQGELLGMVCSSLVFVLLYSYLPHKELRFLLPGLPVLTLGAGYALANLLPSTEGQTDHKPAISSDQRRSKAASCAAWLPGSAVALLAVALNTAATWTLFLPASYRNYPGGEALQRVHGLHDSAVLGGLLPPPLSFGPLQRMCNGDFAQNFSDTPSGCWNTLHEVQYEAGTTSVLFSAARVVDVLPAFLKPPGMPEARHAAPHLPFTPPTGQAAAHMESWGIAPVRVHICTKAAMTGVSRFGERGVPWLYSKNESEALQALPPTDWAEMFEYVIAEPGDKRAKSEHFDVVFRVRALDSGRSVASLLRGMLSQNGLSMQLLHEALQVWTHMQSEQLLVLRSWRLRARGTMGAAEEQNPTAISQVHADGRLMK